MVDKLEACPFCGGEAQRYTVMRGFENRQVCCKSCGASAFDLKWNQRATPANGEQVERADEADRVELAAFLATYANEADGDLVNRNPCDPLLTWGILRRIAATLSTPTEDARDRAQVLEEADAEVERIMSLSDAEVMAEADPSDVAWAQGVKLGTKIGMSAQAEEALRWYAEQVAGCRKIGRAGDPFRQALDQDGGQRARTALGNKETDRHG